MDLKLWNSSANSAEKFSCCTKEPESCHWSKWSVNQIRKTTSSMDVRAGCFGTITQLDFFFLLLMKQLWPSALSQLAADGHNLRSIGGTALCTLAAGALTLSVMRLACLLLMVSFSAAQKNLALFCVGFCPVDLQQALSQPFWLHVGLKVKCLPTEKCFFSRFCWKGFNAFLFKVRNDYRGGAV